MVGFRAFIKRPSLDDTNLAVSGLPTAILDFGTINERNLHRLAKGQHQYAQNIEFFYYVNDKATARLPIEELCKTPLQVALAAQQNLNRIQLVEATVPEDITAELECDTLTQ